MVPCHDATVVPPSAVLEVTVVVPPIEPVAPSNLPVPPVTVTSKSLWVALMGWPVQLENTRSPFAAVNVEVPSARPVTVFIVMLVSLVLVPRCEKIPLAVAYMSTVSGPAPT